MTARVTAFLGSLVLPLVGRRRAALRVEDTFLLLRFAMVAGILLQSSEKKRRPTGCKTAVLQSGDKPPFPKKQAYLAELGRGTLLFGGRTARVQIVEVQDCVQNQRVSPAGLAPVNRIDGEENDVAVAGGDVKDGRMLGDFVAAFH